MMAKPQRQPRQLADTKCDYCRRDKKKCVPAKRIWPGSKCDRCRVKSFPCSANRKASRRLVQHASDLLPAEPSASTTDTRLRTCLDEIECLHELWRHADQLKRYQEKCKPDTCSFRHKIERLVEPIEASIAKIFRGVFNFSESLRSENKISEAMLVTRLTLSNMEPNIYCSIKNEAATIKSYIHWATTAGDAYTIKSMQELLVSHLARQASVDDGLLSHEVGNLMRLYKDTQERQAYTIRRLQLNLDPSQVFQPILHRLVPLGNETVMSKAISMHIQAPEETDDIGRTLLHLAAEHNQIKLINVLLDWKVPIDRKDTFGQTALHAAAAGGCLEAAEKLLAAGADVNAAGANVNATGFAGDTGCTPLQAAAYMGHLKVVERLLAAGADVNTAAGNTERGSTALQAAAYMGHLRVVERLLAAGADVNTAAGNLGRTALHAAAYKGNLEVVESLLAAGADVNATDRNGAWTALRLAELFQHRGVIKRLQKAGARRDKHRLKS